MGQAKTGVIWYIYRSISSHRIIFHLISDCTFSLLKVFITCFDIFLHLSGPSRPSCCVFCVFRVSWLSSSSSYFGFTLLLHDMKWHKITHIWDSHYSSISIVWLEYEISSLTWGWWRSWCVTEENNPIFIALSVNILSIFMKFLQIVRM